MKKVLAMVLCVLLAMGALGAALADEETKLTVSGNGTVLIESDLAVISMGVREVAKDVLEAQASVNGKIASMRHYKDEAKSLKSGSEGGIGLENFQDIKPGDQIEGYRIDQVARTE